MNELFWLTKERERMDKRLQTHSRNKNLSATEKRVAQQKRVPAKKERMHHQTYFPGEVYQPPRVQIFLKQMSQIFD